ncbi:MAG: hypothetical protein DRI30_06340, partial [Chloroflexi bacterium]
HIRGDNNVVIGNYVGTDSSGAVAGVGNTAQGIRVNSTADGNTIGGINAAYANIIAGNNNDGIDHRSTGTANSFLRNSIYSNGNIGIDLANDGLGANNGAGGVTPNDAGDVDPGANNLMNFPVITSAAEVAGTLNVDFDLDVIPAGTYRIEFFTNPSGADGSGNGEGEVYQSTLSIVHAGAGLESFSHSFAGSAGDIVTATGTLCTDGTCTAFLGTSEFSNAFTAVVAPTVVNSTRDVSDLVAGNGVCDTGALNTQGATECTLRAAIEEVNAFAGADTIEFDIPTSELGYLAAPLSYTISLGSDYPAISEQVNIDGATQPDFPGTPIIVMDGTSAGAAHALQLAAGSDSSTVRGLVINNFTSRAIHLVSSSNIIVGNWLGLDVDGVTAAANGRHNLSIFAGSNNNTIGGTLVTDRNVISASDEAGMIIQGDNNDVIGNYIGTNSSGAVTTVGNTFTGVRLESNANNNTIGGTTVPSRNIIAGNGFDGIRHNGTGVANSFLGNSIHSNSLRGIDLGGDGVTANDAGDPDPGANNLLNFSELNSATAASGNVTVDFGLDVPAGDYRIEFFTNPSGADGSGYGEGEVFTSTVNIVHAGGGSQNFIHIFPGAIGDIITATTTLCTNGSCNAFLGTSEFSQFVTAAAPNVVKRAFWQDGTPIPSGVDIPSGVEFKYLLYINNTGGAMTDVSVRDVLDVAFLYQTPSIQVDNSVLSCALVTCDPGEEAAIFTAVDGATVLTDATGDDVVSYGALTIDAGDEYVANLQLDIGGNAVWAILFSVTMP